MWGRVWVALARQTVNHDSSWCSSSGHDAAMSCDLMQHVSEVCSKRLSIKPTPQCFFYFIHIFIFFFFVIKYFIFIFECAAGYGTNVHGSATSVCEGLCFWLWWQATHMHRLPAVCHDFDISSNFWHPKSMKVIASWPQTLRAQLQSCHHVVPRRADCSDVRPNTR